MVKQSFQTVKTATQKCLCNCLRLVVHFICVIRFPDTPCVSQTLSVKFSESNTQSVIDAISSLGEVSMTGSLQIADLVEQPGAILVQWYDEVITIFFLIIIIRYNNNNNNNNFICTQHITIQINNMN